jgi:hypothetical protein
LVTYPKNPAEISSKNWAGTKCRLLKISEWNLSRPVWFKNRILLLKMSGFIKRILVSRVYVSFMQKKQERNQINNNSSVALVRERAIPTERPPLVNEVSANFWG